jgi:lipoprotein signal peptidase
MFQVRQWHWPNYNLADSALVSGVILLVWHALFAKPEGGEGKGESKTETG